MYYCTESVPALTTIITFGFLSSVSSALLVQPSYLGSNSGSSKPLVGAVIDGAFGRLVLLLRVSQSILPLLLLMQHSGSSEKASHLVQ
jgi:hypothetical protein